MLSNLTVPVLNRYDLLQRMLDSIDYPIEHLLVIDNGGELNAVQAPSSVKDFRVLRMVSNLGVATSWNLGVKNFFGHNYFAFASADMWFRPGDLEKLANSSPDKINLHQAFPHWQTFAIGEKVVEKVGLFDESLHPIYFEDTDYERRAIAEGIETQYLQMWGGHDNSSTIHSDNHYKQRNSATFIDNHSYYQDKKDRQDFSAGQWDLVRIRRNSWAK